MGGGEDGLLRACDGAATSGADAVVTIGGGAIHDTCAVCALSRGFDSPREVHSSVGLATATDHDGRVHDRRFHIGCSVFERLPKF